MINNVPLIFNYHTIVILWPYTELKILTILICVLKHHHSSVDDPEDTYPCLISSLWNYETLIMFNTSSAWCTARSCYLCTDICNTRGIVHLKHISVLHNCLIFIFYTYFMNLPWPDITPITQLMLFYLDLIPHLIHI